MRQGESQNRLSHAGLINAQLFIQVGKDRFAPVKDPPPGEALFIWDQREHRIVPFGKNGSTS